MQDLLSNLTLVIAKLDFAGIARISLAVGTLLAMMWRWCEIVNDG